MPIWTDDRLNRLFARYNQEFWSGRLAGWKALARDDHNGLYGFTDDKQRQVYIRLSVHPDDHELRATLIHEMAHAATNLDHGRTWRKEMVRLKREGAPTSPLDFLTPYSCRNIIIDFIEAARAGDSWLGALSELGELHELCDFSRTPVNTRAAHILKQARTLFEIECRRLKRRSGLTDLQNNLGRCQRPWFLILSGSSFLPDALLRLYNLTLYIPPKT